MLPPMKTLPTLLCVLALPLAASADAIERPTAPLRETVPGLRIETHAYPDHATTEWQFHLQAASPAAERKVEGGKKGRQSKQCSLGTDSVPSTAEPKKREPRAKDKVAAATGVSREKLTQAEKLRKAAPAIAAKVEQGELTLEDAAKKTGVVVKTPIKPSVAKPVTQDAGNKPAKSKPTANPLPWQDELTEITDTPDGLRTLRCPSATFYTHKTEPFTGAVMPEGKGWWVVRRDG